MKIFVENLIGEKPHLLKPFNYIKFHENTIATSEFLYTSPSLIKVECDIRSKDYEIAELKFTNTPLRAWVDLWCEGLSGLQVDPHIRKINLSNNNSMQIVSMVEARPELIELNLSSNSNLSYVNVMGATNLQDLNLSNCPNLSNVILGNVNTIQRFSLRNSNLPDKSLEHILGNYIPKYNTSSLYTKKELRSSYFDLRGNYINWDNRLIASKIRMMLTNNILVLWDENPPNSIIPIHYYKKLNSYGRLTN